MTRRALIELIKRNYYNGLPEDDHTLTDNEVNLYINQAVAVAAKASYKEGIEIDGIESVPDAFYSTFKITITEKDSDTGYYYLSLPQAPIGLQRGYGISQLTFPSSTGLAYAPVPISPNELSYMDDLPQAPNKIYYWAEGSVLRMKSFTNLINKKAIIRMVSTADSTLTNEVNLPEDQLQLVMTYVLKMLQSRKITPVDIQNDGVDKPN